MNSDISTTREFLLHARERYLKHRDSCLRWGKVVKELRDARQLDESIVSFDDFMRPQGEFPIQTQKRVRNLAPFAVKIIREFLSISFLELEEALQKQNIPFNSRALRHSLRNWNKKEEALQITGQGKKTEYCWVS